MFHCASIDGSALWIPPGSTQRRIHFPFLSTIPFCLHVALSLCLGSRRHCSSSGLDLSPDMSPSAHPWIKFLLSWHTTLTAVKCRLQGACEGAAQRIEHARTEDLDHKSRKVLSIKIWFYQICFIFITLLQICFILITLFFNFFS